MITVYEIQKFLEKKLNRLGNEQLYKVYYWAKNYDKAYLEAGEGFYIEGQDDPVYYPERQNYILSHIVEYNGSYEPVPNVTISNQDLTVYFYFKMSQLDEVKQRLNDLAKELSGLSVLVKDEKGTEVRVVFRADVPNYVDTDLQHLNEITGLDDRFSFEKTEQYIIGQLQLYFTYTEEVIMGNDLSYLISWNNGPSDTGLTTIRPISNDLSNSIETDGEQELGKITTDHVSTINDSTFQIQFYADRTNKLCNKLFKRIFYGVGQDEVFNISTGGFGNETYGIECLITEISFNANIGEFGTFTITLKRSDS